MSVLCAGSINAQDKQIIDRIIANIGSEIVLLSEMEEQFALLKAEQGSLTEDMRCLVMDNILAQKLLLNQARLDSVVVTDEEVEAQLDARIDRILQLMNGDISQFEAYYGSTITEVKSQFREDLRNQLLTERMQGQIMQSATITPSEVKNFFSRIPKDSLPYFNAEVEVAEIVYFAEPNETEKERVRNQLQEIRKRIVEGGEDFAELATTYSTDGSSRAGGDLGWAKRGDYVLEFEATAYNLEKNEISEVIETEFGFHIIQLLERRGNSIHVRHILMRPEIKAEDMAIAQKHLDSIRQLIISDSLSFSRAVKKYSSDRTQSYNNDGRMVNPQSGNTFFEIADLDPGVYFTIDTMGVGEISAPFAYQTPRGESAFRIVLLQSRSAPHVASLEQDYSKIQAAALEQKRAKIINDWVSDKINATYVEIDPSLMRCTAMQRWKKEF